MLKDLLIGIKILFSPEMIAISKCENVEGMFGMIDINCHILPGLDDGAQSEKDSLRMAKEAINQGVYTIIATPHHQTSTYQNIGKNILKHVSILNELFKNNHLNIKILPGQETRINGDIIKDLKNGEVIPLYESRYLLIELPTNHVPQYTERLFFDIQIEGYVPVIAHPEKNNEIRKNPSVLYHLVRKGALTQLTASSLIGKDSKKTCRFSEQLIEAHLVHFIASNAYDKRYHLKKAFDYIRGRFGLEWLYFFLENSQLLVENMNIHKMEPRRIRKRKFLGLFGGSGL